MLPRSLVGLAGSFLGDLSESTLDDLLEDAVLRDYRRGEQIFEEEPHPRIGLILEGTARAYLTGPDGRQLTVRYVPSRSSLSTQTSGVAQNALRIDVEAVSNVAVIELNLQTFGRLQSDRVDLINAVAVETQRRLSDVYRAFAATVFGTVRERLATHLLESAEQTGRGLIATVTQQDLAEALGTAREVVSRALQQLQTAGIVALERRGIAIIDPPGLMAETGRWGFSSRLFGLDTTAYSEQSFDSAPQPVVAIDGVGDIVYANSAIEGTFGVKPRDAVGRAYSVLLPKAPDEQFQRALADFLANMSAGPVGLGGGYIGRRKDGSEFPAEITILPARHSGSTILFTTIVDVTYRSVLRARLEGNAQSAHLEHSVLTVASRA